MASDLLTALFEGGSPLVYRTWINDTLLLTHWTTYRGRSTQGLHTFEMFMELDPTAMGGGGSMILGRSRLSCDALIRPVRYTSEAAGASLAVQVSDDMIHLTVPGQRVPVARKGAEWIMELYALGMDAMSWAMLARQGRLDAPVALELFLVNQAMVVPYTITPAPELAAEGCRGFRTSYGEQVLIDDNGVLRRTLTPAHGARTELLSPGPALPAWRMEMTATSVAAARYTRPADASFTLEDVTIDGGAVAIGGSLTIPSGDGARPAVLFLGGSGTHDRHGMSGEMDLGNHEHVDHLAERGFVGLRIDKRGAGTTPVGPDPYGTSLAPIIDDAEAALTWLRARDEVDPKRVFLVGHSEGGTVALILATHRQAEPAGLVLLAPGSVRMDAIMKEQVAAHGERTGMTPEQVAAQLGEAEQFLEAVRSGREFAPHEVPDLVYLGARDVPWIRDHFTYQVSEMLSAVDCPVLILHGDKDFQVPVEQSEALAAGEPAVAFGRLPGLDHLLKRSEGESTLAEYFTDRRVDPSALTALTDWLTARAG